ncbi:excinuclease ABC subunit A, partial [Bordetella pertussis]
PSGWLELNNIYRHNLHNIDARIPLGVLTAVTGISGSGKSSLVSQALPELVLSYLGNESETENNNENNPLNEGMLVTEVTQGSLAGDVEAIQRLVQVDQKP